MIHRASPTSLAPLVLLVGAMMPATAVRAEPPTPPPYYAIRDARVVTGTGQVYERATVRIADGLIEAVGPDVEIPGDARVLDGSGLTVYPGLIDAMTSLGQPAESSGGEGGGFPGSPFGGGPVARGPEDRPKTTPWVKAADELVDDDDVFAPWRRAGFTAAVTVPREGYFPGQAAVVSLVGAEHGAAVVATPVAQLVRLDGAGSFLSFPGSLMGRIAYVKQVFSDARHEDEADAVYRADPRGRSRPSHDPTLGPIRDAMAGGLPFLMPGDLGRDIDRALAIAEEYEVSPVLYGGHGAWTRAARLADAGVATLVHLEWPSESNDADPDTDTPLPELAHRRLAPATPARLAAAGARFAFTGDGLAGPDKAFEGVRAAIEAGLSSEDAIRALTLDAARIFGVDDRLGSVETGKIANLVLASAEPWAEDVEIAAVFVDGRLFQTREDEDADEGPPPSTDVSGTWKLTMTTPRGTRDVTAELSMDESGKVTGELAGERDTTAIEKGRMRGDTLSFRTTRTMGPRTMTATITLEIDGEQASGAMRAGPMAMDIAGERTALASEADGDDDAEAVPHDEIEAALAVYQGPVRRYDRFAIVHARIEPVSGEPIADGTIVVENGTIRAVGAEVEVPKGYDVIDAAGGTVIPGIIDAHSHIAGEGGLNEASVNVSAMVSVGDVIDPDDIAIYRALAGGVTTINILHGSSNPIGGQNAVIKLRWGADAHGLRLAGAPPGIKFALGENPKRSNFPSLPGRPARYPATRMGVMDVIRQAFTDARAYRDAWQTYRKDKAAGREPMPPRRDLLLEPLVEILEGERLVHAHCYRADEILQLLRLAEEQGFRVATLQHVLEGYKVADEIAAHGAGASTFSDWWGYKVEAYEAIPHNAALMAERGVSVSINSDSGEEMRHLNQEAAKAVRWGGMGRRDALSLVTLNPATQLGIDDRVGSIEVGKDADLVLYDGDPLSAQSVVLKTFVDGDLYFDIEADRERQATIDAMKARLAPPEDEDEDEDGDDRDDGDEVEEASSETPSSSRWRTRSTYSCREEG